MTYRHTADMGEISELGGDYEKCCQDMLEAGCEWLAAKPDADLQGHEYKNIFGIFTPDSDDAKALDKVVIDASKGYGATGAMHHAVMSRLFFIAKNGWSEYARQLRDRRQGDDS